MLIGKIILHLLGEFLYYTFHLWHYYLIANDESFDVRLVCWGDINNRQVIEKDLANTYHDVIYTEPSFRAKIKKISNIEISGNVPPLKMLSEGISNDVYFVEVQVLLTELLGQNAFKSLSKINNLPIENLED